jgi:hypothetical protein
VNGIFIPGQITHVEPYLVTKHDALFDQGVVIRVSLGVDASSQHVAEVVRDTESLVGLRGVTISPYGHDGCDGSVGSTATGCVASLWRRRHLHPVDWNYDLWRTLATGLAP